MKFSYVLAFSCSFLICFVLTPIITKTVEKWGIVTKSNLKESDNNISCLGSIAIYVSFIITVAVVAIWQFEFTPQLKGILIGSTWILLIGLLDDLIELSPAFKFAGQIVGVVIIILFGIRTQIVLIPNYINLFFTAIWVLGITNAFNLLDILDGLSVGLAIIASFTFLIISILTHNLFVGIMTATLAGSGLAFLRYNFPPSKIFMGDAGSLFIGFILASCAIAISYAIPGREVALLTPILVLGFPVYDTFFVVLMRFINGKSVIKKSKDHFALRMIANGLSKKKTLFFIWLFSGLFSISAIKITKVSNRAGIILLVSLILISITVGKIISRVPVDE